MKERKKERKKKRRRWEKREKEEERRKKKKIRKMDADQILKPQKWTQIMSLNHNKKKKKTIFPQVFRATQIISLNQKKRDAEHILKPSKGQFCQKRFFLQKEAFSKKTKHADHILKPRRSYP